jgi:long-chain fatty acid transport protein
MTRTMKRIITALFGLAAAGIVDGHCSSAWAQGYGLYEQSACAMGRAGAGVAAPCDDGSSLFLNPAGLALSSGTVVSASATSIAPRGQFTNTSTTLASPLSSSTYYVPTAYFATPAGRQMTAGVGLFAPYGLGVDWPATSEGRFLSYKSSVKSFYVQPSVAVKVNEHLVIGGGVDITHTTVELRRRVDLSTQTITGTPLTFRALGIPPGTDFADIGLTGSTNGFGGHIGVIVKITDQVSMGARYLSRQNLSFNNLSVTPTQVATGLSLPVALPGLPAGTPLDRIVGGSFAAGQALGAQTATTGLPLPDQAVVGIAVQPMSGLKVLADYQYTHWKLLSQITIVNQLAPPTTYVETYGDTNAVRVGAEYVLGRAAVRAGFDMHDAASPDQSVTPLLPEAARQEITAGATVPIAAHARIDLAYMYVHQSDRAGRTTDGGLATPTVALNSGTYHYYANLFGVSVVVRF